MRDDKTKAMGRRRAGRFGRVALVAVGLSVVGSCAPKFYERRADREARRNLYAKTGGVENVDNESLEIVEAEMRSLDDLRKNATGSEFLGARAELESGARVLNLADAVGLAVDHNRPYLTRKETIYLQALDLTLTRWEYAPIFRGEFDVGTDSDTRTGDPPAPTVGDAIGADGVVQRRIDSLIATNTITRRQSVGVTMLQRTGARLAADFTSDFLRFLAGDSSINNSALAVTLTQPLLKGGGFATTMEALTQADRDLLYSLRDFANFRREFVVGVVTNYYGVLRTRDTVRNNWIAYQGFVVSVEREEALAEEDRRTQTEIGELQQALLRSETVWITAIRDYENQLDQLKIDLGISIDEKIVLDDDELTNLAIVDPDIRRTQAIDLALKARPDLHTVEDRVVDAERHIKVAKVELQAGLDAVGTYDAISSPGDRTPRVDFRRRKWAAGLELDLPLDRKAERNFYQSTLIALAQAKRQRILAIDEVKQQIYDDWRALGVAKKNFEIAELGVELAVRRLEEQMLLAELGRGEARLLVDAQRELVNSRNQRTATLIEHTVARLRLWQDMGVLYINGDGSWVEKLEEEGLRHE